MNKNLVNQIESCKRGVSIKTIFALAFALACDPRRLICSSECRFKREESEMYFTIYRRTIFSENLKRLRHSRGISQNNLMKKAGLGTSTIALIEVNKRDVTLKTIFALASALECDPCDFLNPI